MNLHQGPLPIASGPEPTPRLRYAPVHPREAPAPVSATGRLAVRIAAPLLGSRLLFPRRFDRAFARLVEDPKAAIVPPEYALRYFGEALHLDIDPLSLTHRISDWVREPGGRLWVGTSFLDSADWSDAIAPLDKSPVHREMQEVAAAEGDLRGTRAHKRLMSAITRGRPGRRNSVTLDSAEAIDAYLLYCRDLIESVRARGVMRRTQSGAFHGLSAKHRDVRSLLYDSTERDIGIAIAEDGRIIRHLGGKHRTAIAQALRLHSIPVEVRMVHTAWLAGQMERTGLPPHRALAEGVRTLKAIRV